VRQAAEEACQAIAEAVSPHALPLLLPLLWEAMDSKRLWQTKLAAVNVLRVMTRRASRQVTSALPDIIPPLSERMCDAKQQVQVCGNPGNCHKPHNQRVLVDEEDQNGVKVSGWQFGYRILCILHLGLGSGGDGEGIWLQCGDSVPVSVSELS
jgi:hypothetical protein